MPSTMREFWKVRTRPDCGADEVDAGTVIFYDGQRRELSSLDVNLQLVLEDERGEQCTAVDWERSANKTTP